MSIDLHHGDCRSVIKTLADNSIDSVVTDPPYALKFMGKAWDTGEAAFDPAFWAEVLRVLKPGGHIVAFSGTRTYHRMTCAIEDAGFEIRDQIGWIYGSGFPKSHDVSKGIDRAAGKLAVQSVGFNVAGKSSGLGTIQRPELRSDHPDYQLYAPATDEAIQWQGWGTALKPAWEPICLARKPLIGTVAANVLAHGTGAINVDGCRVGEREETQFTGAKKTSNTYGKIDVAGGRELPPGRWPANIVHDGSDEVLAGFPESISTGGSGPASKEWRGDGYTVGASLAGATGGLGDSGSAARFFYTAKADAEDRFGSKHPTIKPVDLMQWLVRLITPKGGTVLDPFAGTGTTGEACFREGMNCILIEREEEYLKDIRIRMKHAADGPLAREHARMKHSGKVQDAGPLFGDHTPQRSGNGRQIYGVFADQKDRGGGA